MYSTHSSENRGLCLMKSSNKTLQISKFALFYIVYKNTKLHFTFFDVDQNKVAQNEKQKIQFWVFVYIKYMAFRWNFLSSINLFFLKCELHSQTHQSYVNFEECSKSDFTWLCVLCCFCRIVIFFIKMPK